MHQLNVDVIIFLEFINTPGTEITPRSNVIGKDFQNDRFGHFSNFLPVNAPVTAENRETDSRHFSLRITDLIIDIVGKKSSDSVTLSLLT